MCGNDFIEKGVSKKGERRQREREKKKHARVVYVLVRCILWLNICPLA